MGLCRAGFSVSWRILHVGVHPSLGACLHKVDQAAPFIHGVNTPKIWAARPPVGRACCEVLVLHLCRKLCRSLSRKMPDPTRVATKFSAPLTFATAPSRACPTKGAQGPLSCTLPLCRKWPETARFDKGSRQSGQNRWFGDSPI